ncbi:hypothetical protein ACF3NG_06690 [Aerococcaceae bacterium WGS1372]
MNKIKQGDKFGEWTVLKKSDKSSHHTCECSCGVVKDVANTDLLNGVSRSCGHAKVTHNIQSHYKRTDKKILGNTFGHWTPLERVNKSGQSKYLCKCSCGVQRVVTASSLLNGTSRSCGHVKKEYDTPENAKLMNEVIKENLVENTNLLILNQKVAKNSTTGVKGVHPTKNGKYRAYISFKGKRTYLGTHDTLEEAAKARKDAEEELYKPFLESYENKDE